MNWHWLAFFCIVMSLNLALGAQSNVAPGLQNYSISELPSPLPSDSPTVRRSFDLRFETLFSPDYNATAARSFGFFGFTFRQLGSANYGMDLSVEVAPHALELSHLNPSQMYYTTNNLSIGRKILTWSLVDEEFHLGLFQPQLRWNPLLPRTQGLTGVFYEMPVVSRDLHFTFFASAVSIPDQGPGFVFREGEFRRENPWFQYQPTTVRVTGSDKVRALSYDVQVPPYDQLLVNPSVGVTATMGSNETSFQARISGAYKASHQINFGTDGTAEPDRAHLVVAPAINDHALVGADLVFRRGDWQWDLSGLLENTFAPKRQRKGFTYVTYSPMQVASTGLTWQGEGGKTRARVAGLLRRGGLPRALDEAAYDVSALVPNRITYQNALSVSLSTKRNLGLPRPLGVSTTWLQGIGSTFASWLIGADYKLTSSWSLQGSVLLVRADASSPSLYRSLEDNDFVQLGLSYEF